MDHDQRDQHDEHDQPASPDGRPVDPSTGQPAEPYVESTSEVPERDPAPSPTEQEWSVEEGAEAPEG